MFGVTASDAIWPPLASSAERTVCFVWNVLVLAAGSVLFSIMEEVISEFPNHVLETAKKANEGLLSKKSWRCQRLLLPPSSKHAHHSSNTLF